MNLKLFGDKFLQKYGEINVTPYLHIVICHSVMLLQRYGSISQFSQQGFEATHKWHRIVYYSSTNRDGGKGKTLESKSALLQIIYKTYRLQILEAYLFRSNKNLHNFF